MKIARILAALAIAVSTFSVWAASEDGGRTYQLKNRLRVEYDDNIYETKDDTTDSIKIIEEIEFTAVLNLEPTFISLRYRPTYVWWDEREPDDDDFHHDFDITLSHSFTPRLSASLKDTLRVAELPELIDRGTTVREKDDFIYNIVDGTISYLLQPQTRLEGGARYTILRYDDDEVADRDDYDIYAGGLTLRHQVVPETAILGEYRREQTEYTETAEGDRGSVSDFIGGGLEQIFSPNLLGNVRAGYQRKEFEADIDEESQPYVDGSLTYLPSPRTRLTAGVGYSMFEADVFSFANQDRTLAFLSLGHDLTARVSLFVSGSYALGEYDLDQAVRPEAVDGDEEVRQLSARASYKVNNDNWLEIGWIYLDLDSDLRDDFERNRYELGWRLDL